MPVRDAEATLGTALSSIRRQSYENFECLVVDDGSRDRSSDLARGVASADSRFRVLQNDAPGLVGALNLAVRSAQGAWLARLDADDWMHRERLIQQLGAVQEHPSWDGTGCHVKVFPRNHLRLGRLEYERWLNSLQTADEVRRDRFVECPLAHPTWFVRKSLLLEFPYREVDGPEDYDLLLRVLGAGRSLGVVPRRLVFWRDHEARLSRVDPRYQVERFVTLKACYLASDFLAGHPRYVLVGYGRTGKQLSRALRPLGFQPSHVVEVHPGRVGQTILGAPVIGLDQFQALHAERCIVCVAGLDARSAIRRALWQMGKVEERDFVCAA